MRAPKLQAHPTRVEFSQDGGRSWRLWCYGEKSPGIYRRLCKLYPSWEFTLITPKGRWTTDWDMSENKGFTKSKFRI